MAVRCTCFAAVIAAACSSPPGTTGEQCRGDEALVDGACVPWYEAPMSVDFDLSVDGRAVTVVVHEGGFPREWVDSLRFTFGDGFSGYGETASHTYADDGVYAVDLVVRLRGYRLLRASKLAVIGAAATRIELTINATPALLNGTTPFTSDSGTPGDPDDDVVEPFHLLVPQTGVDVDVALFDAPGAEVDPASIRLVADVPLGGGAVAAGTDLADRLSFAAGEADLVGRGTWTVGEGDELPVGMVTLTLEASDAAGGTHQQSITFEVTELTPALDPFDREMVWLFRFDLDLYTATATEAGGIDSVEGSNGVPDFLEELRLLGAQGSSPELDEIYAGWIIDAVIAEVHRYYGMTPEGEPRDDIALRIFAVGDPGAPDPAEFAEDGSFSMIRFGGTLGGFLGFSRFAPYNEGRVDDTTAGLGVATATLIGTLMTTAVVVEEFFPILPGVGQVIGDHPSDATVLSPAFDRFDPANDPDDNRRYDELAVVARQLGMAIAAVTAHEMGHAMGLMPDGAPPLGFFGGRPDVEFMNADRTNSHHADFPFLNLMQAGGNIILTLSEALEKVEYPEDYNLTDLVLILAQENRLSPYSRAYFRRAQTYANFEGAPAGLCGSVRACPPSSAADPSSITKRPETVRP